jgi:chemotaxis-related protein WspB
MLLLKFEIGTAAYALDSACIEEVVPWVQLRPVPHAPAFLPGVFHYRGKVIPVVDVGLLLGQEAARDRLSTRIIVVRTGKATASRRLLGLLASRVSDLVRVTPAQLQPAAVQLNDAPYLGPVAQTPEGLMQLLHVDYVLPENLLPSEATLVKEGA